MTASLGSEPPPSTSFRPQPHAAFMPDLPAAITGVLPFYNDDSGKRLFRFSVIALLVEVFGIAFLVGGAWLLLLILQMLGINIPLFDSLAMKPRDIEFVLVESPTAKPRKPTKNRAEHDTRSGGKKIENMREAESHKAAGTHKPQKAAKQTPKPTPRPVPQKPTRRPTRKKTVSKRPTPPKPTRKAVKKPTPRRPAPKLPMRKTTSKHAPTAPRSPKAPTIKTPAPSSPRSTGAGRAVPSGPIASSRGSRSGSASRGAPAPTQIPGSLGGSRSSGRSSRGGRSAPRGQGGRSRSTQHGSPGGGGGRSGIDAQAEPDFGPYIAELQRRIKRNWQPPADNRNKRIVALFTVGRDGRLVSLRIEKSSGVKVADDAALMAVRASAPFRPLPANFKGRDIDVQFIFDYNVFSGAKKR